MPNKYHIISQNQEAANEHEKRPKEEARYETHQSVDCSPRYGVSTILLILPPLAYYSYGDSYGSDYPYQDDPDYGDHYYWDENGRKVTNVARSYDDGTMYKAQYKYDSLGN